MTYKDLYEKADRKLEKGEITFGEFDEMTKPLDEEIRPHGEWGEWNEDRGYPCSNCGEYLPYSDEYDYQSDFCPNCGADMRRKV